MASCQRDREMDIATNYQEMETMLHYEEHFREFSLRMSSKAFLGKSLEDILTKHLLRISLEDIHTLETSLEDILRGNS